MAKPLYINRVVEELNPGVIGEFVESARGLSKSLLTVGQLDLAGYAPSPFWSIAKETGVSFPRSTQDLVRQLEGDTIAQIAVLEGAVKREGFVGRGWLAGKATAMYRIASLAANIGETIPPAELPRSLEKFLLAEELQRINAAEALDFVYDLKRAYFGVLRRHRFQTAEHDVKPQTKRPRLRFSFVDTIRDRFPDAKGILLFGSALDGAESGNLEGTDIDTTVIVPKITRDMYQGLIGRPLHYEGKEIDTVLVEESAWIPYILANPVSLGIVEKWEVLFGEVPMPGVNRELAVLRAASRASGRIRSLHGLALNLYEEKPRELESNPGLLYALSKTSRHLLEALLNLRDLRAKRPHVHYTKADLKSRLTDYGVSSGQSGSTPVRDGLYNLMTDCARIVAREYDRRWTQAYGSEIAALNKRQPGEFAFVDVK